MTTASIRAGAAAFLSDHDLTGAVAKPVKAAGVQVFDAIADELDDLRADQTSGLILEKSWADLAARSTTDLSDGDGAEVIGDAGTHTDPVAGGAVSNSGRFRLKKTGSPTGWERIGGAAGQDNREAAEAAASDAEAAATTATSAVTNVVDFFGRAGGYGITDLAAASEFTTAGVEIAFADALFREGTTVLAGLNDVPGWAFNRSGSAVSVDANGVVQTAANDTPRIGQALSGVSLDVLGLVIEPARTNLLLRSAEFDNASWTKTGATITANATAAPDGTTTADKIVGANATGHQRAQQAFACTNGQRQTVSIFAKAIPGETRWMFFRLAEGAAPSVYFDVLNGVVGVAESGWLEPHITELANGWYRCEASFVASATTHTIRFGPCDNGDTSGSGPTSTFTGDGSKGLYLWGAQAEQAQDASSYIATAGSTATRSADNARRTWTPEDRGALYIEFIAPRIQNDFTVNVVGTTTSPTLIGMNNGQLLSSNGSTVLASGSFVDRGEIVRAVLTWGPGVRRLYAQGYGASDAEGIGEVTTQSFGNGDGHLNSVILRTFTLDGVTLSETDCAQLTGGSAALPQTFGPMTVEAPSEVLKIFSGQFGGDEKVYLGQQGPGDLDPGAGVVGIKSADGTKRAELTRYQYGTTIRTYGSGLIELFINDDPGGTANFSVRGNGAMGGAKIEARNGADTWASMLSGLGTDRTGVGAYGATAPDEFRVFSSKAGAFFTFVGGVDDDVAGGAEFARISEEGLRLAQRATAPTPPAGTTVLWAKTDGTVQATSNVGGTTTTTAL